MFHFPVAANEKFDVIVLNFKFQSNCSEIELELYGFRFNLKGFYFSFTRCRELC